MSIPAKTEQSLLSHDELEIVRGTHHPAIYDSDAAALKALKTRLRDERIASDPHVCSAGLPFGVDVHETTVRMNVRWMTPLGEVTASTS